MIFQCQLIMVFKGCVFRVQRSVTGGSPPTPLHQPQLEQCVRVRVAGWIWGVYWGTDASREKGGGRAGRRLKKQGLSG